MQIWVGLGNPGAQYAMHRHNVGFMVADLIADLYRFSPPRKQFQGWTQEGRIGPEKILLLKPATFMNESGRAVGEGVGELIQLAAERGRKTRPGIKLGICGEHGGDPASIAFCEATGLDYVSASPYRVPIARLAAAQAALANKK
jgi:hypothetical protein